MKWTREVSRDRRDCVCQPTTAPPPAEQAQEFCTSGALRASGCQGTVDAVSMRTLLLAVVALVAIAAPTSAPVTPRGINPVSSFTLTARDAPTESGVPKVSAAPAVYGWMWPVAGPRRVVRPFIAPPTPYGAGHRGVDLGAPEHGVEVRAVTGGVVHFAGIVVDRPVITVRSGQILATVEPVVALVAAGESVRAGQVIGLLESGHCQSPCVHLGVRLAGEYVSPLLYLGGLRRAVLLPLE
jgi:murein DD-endopeptidase MepM/ murein hydrolase activator NlpD